MNAYLVTGQIATGKSHFTSIISKKGYKFFCADSFVSELYKDKNIIENIKNINKEFVNGSSINKDKIRNKWPIQAKTPIAAIIDHWLIVGWTQTNGITQEIMIAPTTPVNNKVNKARWGGSDNPNKGLGGYFKYRASIALDSTSKNHYTILSKKFKKGSRTFRH